ncbi:MAG: DUF971 domain-containing protein [Pseudomonadota bacterium]
MNDAAPPTGITLRRQSRCLELTWGDGRNDSLSFEFLRVHSPSAEVQGHSPDQVQLQYGKRDVRITRIDPVGQYALKLVFSDGHDSGLFSWRYLRELGETQEARWQAYLAALQAAGHSREPETGTDH